MGIFTLDKYQKDRESVLAEYVKNMTIFIKKKHPQYTEDQIKEIIRTYVKSNIHQPKARIVNHPIDGEAEFKDVNLISHTNGLKQNIVSPSGSAYVRPSVEESLIKIKINVNKKARKRAKNEMFAAINNNDSILAAYKNYEQANIKIETNALSGASASQYNIFFDLACYNSITSIARFSAMTAYSYVEKFLEGNFFFPNIESVINYIVLICRFTNPRKIQNVIQKYNLFIPSVGDIVDNLKESIQYYFPYTEEVDKVLLPLLNTLTLEEKVFLYYAHNFKNIVRKNTAYFKPFLSKFFNKNVPVDNSTDPNNIFKTDDAMLAMALSLNADNIDRKALNNETVNEHPDGVRVIQAIIKHMDSTVNQIDDIIDTFIRIPIDTQNVMDQPAMIRRSVLISDTDSVIFTTQSWVEWYCGDVSYDEPAYEINAFVVYMLSKTIEHVFARISSGFGMEEPDMHAISAKNEFLYPIMLRTNIGKHYAGIVTIQEGKILPKPKRDIKGKQLRGSDLCKDTIKEAEEFAFWIIDNVYKHKKIDGTEITKRMLDYEHYVYKSIMDGEKKYLTSTPIKDKDDYSEKGASKFFYHDLWQDVFAEKYGDFIVPSKGYVIKVASGGQKIRDPRYLEYLKNKDPRIHKKLVTFLENNTRQITMVIMPGTVDKIPDILRPIVDVRNVIYENIKPMYLLVSSLNVGITHKDHMTLLSDIYGFPDNADL